jgi:DNA-binding transcriptional regulator GbsR (MarR family)
MTAEEKIKKEMLETFGEAYKAFGLNKLMGHIVSLLIYSPEPLSLDEIAEQLGRSKGPVSQILRRLRDRKLVRKAWTLENHRKDYYEIEPEVFENAFRNNFELIKNNTRIAKLLKAKIKKSKSMHLEVFGKRINEMELFYLLMEKHFKNFLTEWREEITK